MVNCGSIDWLGSFSTIKNELFVSVCERKIVEGEEQKEETLRASHC